MRLAKERVHHMAESVIARLHELGFLDVTGDRKALRDSLEQTMTEELGVEDRLNAEVRRTADRAGTGRLPEDVHDDQAEAGA